jgi:hypothetical protein
LSLFARRFGNQTFTIADDLPQFQRYTTALRLICGTPDHLLSFRLSGL